MASSSVVCQRLQRLSVASTQLSQEARSPDCVEAIDSSFLQRQGSSVSGHLSQSPGVRWFRKSRGNSTMCKSASPTKTQDASMCTMATAGSQPVVAVLKLPLGKQELAAKSAEPLTQTHIVHSGQARSETAQVYTTDPKTLHELNQGVALDYARPEQTIIVIIVKEATEGGSGSALTSPPPEGTSPASSPHAQASWGTPPSPQTSAALAKPKAGTLTAPESIAPKPEQHKAEASREPLLYRVQPGDSLLIIAEKFGVSMSELAELNELHFTSMIHPTQVLKLPANVKPQAALVSNVCPAPAPTCPPSYKKSHTSWLTGFGVALLLAAGAVFAAKLCQGWESRSKEGKPQTSSVNHRNQTDGESAVESIVADAGKGAKVTSAATSSFSEPAFAVTKQEAAAIPVTSPEGAASSASGKHSEKGAAALTQQDGVSHPQQTAAPIDALAANVRPAETRAQSEITLPLIPSEMAPLPVPNLSASVVTTPEVALGEIGEEPKDAAALVAGQAPQAASAEPVEKATPAVVSQVAASGSRWVEVTDLPSFKAVAQQPEWEAPGAKASANDMKPASLDPVVGSVAEWTALVIREGEGTQKAAAKLAALEKALEVLNWTDARAVPVDNGFDEYPPLELADLKGKQPEASKSRFGIGSSFCQGSTITRALEDAFSAASQALGPLHQTLTFVALSSGRIELVGQDHSGGSTGKELFALRTLSSEDCHIEGTHTWGVHEQANGGGGEEKEWAAVLLFSARDCVLSSGSMITTGSARLAMEMAAKGLATKAVGKKLKDIIILSESRADPAAIDVVGETFPGLKVYNVWEFKPRNLDNRLVPIAKESQVGPHGARRAVAPGVSLLGVTEDADFGGALLATAIGDWLYGSKCAIDMPRVVSNPQSLKAKPQQFERMGPDANAPTNDKEPVALDPVMGPGAGWTAIVELEGEGRLKGTAAMATLERALKGLIRRDERAIPDASMPDEVLPREVVDSKGRQPEASKSKLGVGSGYGEESTVTRAIQKAYLLASLALGPMHQTLAFVAVSSRRPGRASQDYTWGSTANAVIALRTLLPTKCHLQGICSWGVHEQANGGGSKDKDWAAVLLFSARDGILWSNSTTSTGSVKLAATMAAEGLAAKAVGKKLKAVIIVSSPQADRAAINVVRKTIPGLPVFGISEGKFQDSNRPVPFAKDWQVVPPGALRARAPGVSLLGVTTNADFGGPYLACVIGQWLYGPECVLDVVPWVSSKETAISGR